MWLYKTSYPQPFSIDKSPTHSSRILHYLHSDVDQCLIIYLFKILLCVIQLQGFVCAGDHSALYDRSIDWSKMNVNEGGAVIVRTIRNSHWHCYNDALCIVCYHCHIDHPNCKLIGGSQRCGWLLILWPHAEGACLLCWLQVMSWLSTSTHKHYSSGTSINCALSNILKYYLLPAPDQ